MVQKRLYLIIRIQKPNTYHDYDLGGDKIPVFEPRKQSMSIDVEVKIELT